jgi:hypothetical protein
MLRLGTIAILAGLTVAPALAQLPSLPAAPLPLQPATFTPVAALEQGMDVCKQMFATRHPPPPGWRAPAGSTWDQAVATAKARGLSDISTADLKTQGWVTAKFGPSTLPGKRGAWGRVSVRPTPASCAVELYPDPRTELPRPELKSAALAWAKVAYPTAVQSQAADGKEFAQVNFRSPDGMRVHIGFVDDPVASGNIPGFAGDVWVQFIYSPPRETAPAATPP